jgi:alpha-maltose-1-phosphate synthase
MNICHVISVPFPPVEGIGTYVNCLSTKLIEKGHKVTVITRGPLNGIQKDVINGIEVIRVPFIPIYPFYMHVHEIFVNKVIKSLESKIDIVHIHSPLVPLIHTSHPILTTIHTPMLTDSYYRKVNSLFSIFSKISQRFVSYPLEMKLMKSSDLITTLTASISEELVNEYGLKQKEIIVIGNGVDEKFFYPKYTQSGYGNNEKKYILFVGRMDREKGLFDLIECGKFICDARSDIFFLIVGGGRDLDKLKGIVKKLELQQRFIFLGQIDKEKLIDLYQHATLFVLPSYHEGLPTVLLEAMSSGVPVVATNVRGNQDIVSSGKNGMLVPPRDPKKMAEVILTLLEDERLMKIFGENARKTIEEKYTWDRVSNDVLSCYKLLVSV